MTAGCRPRRPLAYLEVHMKPWEHLATASTPDGSHMELLRHDGDYLIRIDGYELMTSRAHQSEEVMMELACPHPSEGARVLVGGLGMGYTAAAVLAMLPERATLVVSELVPAVVEWNRGPLGPLAGNPLDDPRTQIEVRDVAQVIRTDSEGYDAILLDVDNGPSALSERSNSWLYSPAGLSRIREALRPNGGLAIWSVGEDASFERRLRSAGFTAATHRVNAHGRRGTRHVVFVGKRR
jgi:spermidine synthase